MRDAPDEVLVSRVQAGDEAAFEEIHRRYADRLLRYCTSILGNREEAEEATQSALFSAYQSLRADTRQIELRGWLYRIAHNRSLDTLRARRSAEPLSGLETSLVPGPETQVELREDVNQLSSDLRALPAAQRSALVLRELGGLSHARIGEALEATPAAAKALIRGAREALMDFESGRGLACSEVRARLDDLGGRVPRGRILQSHLRSCAGCEAHRSRLAARRA